MRNGAFIYCDTIVPKSGRLPPNSTVNFGVFWPHSIPAVTTDGPFGRSGPAPALRPARGLRGPCYLSPATLLTRLTGQRRVISVLPQRNTGTVRGTGGLPSRLSAPIGARRDPLAGPGALPDPRSSRCPRSPHGPCPPPIPAPSHKHGPGRSDGMGGKQRPLSIGSSNCPSS